MPVTRISVVIPVRDGLPAFRDCLAAAVGAASEDGNTELLVVDNGSSDDGPELVRSFQDVQLLLAPPPATIGATRNVGAALAGGSILYFVDSDCVITAAHLEGVRHWLGNAAGNDRVAAVGAKVLAPATDSWVARYWLALHADRVVGDVRYINSGNLAVSATAFREIGGFDEILATGEDPDLCARLRQRGYRIVADPALASVHLRNASDLPSFFRKELWYGTGMWQAAAGGNWTKILLLTIAFWICLLAGVILAPFRWQASLVALGVATLIPVGICILRRPRGLKEFAAGVLLYWVYLLARGIALIPFLAHRSRTRAGAM